MVSPVPPCDGRGTVLYGLTVPVLNSTHGLGQRALKVYFESRPDEADGRNVFLREELSIDQIVRNVDVEFQDGDLRVMTTSPLKYLENVLAGL